MRKLVHVIGAGLAGLAAAVQLQRRGAQVALYEAAEQAGGRCRSYYDRTLGATVDSGNHVVVSGNHATLNYVRAIGAGDELVGPTQPELNFIDVATRMRWTVRPSPGRVPFWMLDPAARVPHTHVGDYLSLVPLLFAKPGRTLAQTMRCNGALWDRMLGPLLTVMMNVDPRNGTAELAAAAVRETLATGGDAYRPLVARDGLSSTFVDPALRLLQHGGATIRLNARLDAIEFADSRATALQVGGERIALEDGEAAVLAVPPHVAQALVPGVQAPQRFSPMVTAHFAIEPPAGHPPTAALINGNAHWLVAADGRLSATAYGAERLAGMPRDALAQTLWTDVAQAAGLPAQPLPIWQIGVEPYATFAAVPDEEMRRPAARTRWNNLMLAGDWTATGLPATIEGAIRSGQKAADLLLNEPMGR
ncbi:hydroxysqualene dehydroxylase HpnE [Paraburkholderia edwinii]|jgi:squalene-associated FAD-dependent desaturase|uniref:Hydroxysqualene dehydroxylase HpnE n=1 Tax=Paraburkholderia edwinii TaxID=2861782 RepID=A0ABX8UUU8_9BURK|nr:hydroxysqualene dehydroxylase HpnE [Paraburkholderia edwinii]QYD72767.1 hydroxysqualene dehydroxylase HpnE [Paraburkholderia edwinii]